MSVFILTTHSMDEAEALCNNIGIMVNGRLRCYGTATHIKNKFSSGYEFFLKVRYPREEEINEFINKLRTRYLEDVIGEEEVANAMEILDCGDMFPEISKEGTGSHLKDEMNESGKLGINNLVEWIIVERYGQAIYRWLTDEFVDITLIEHYGTYFKYRLEKQSKGIGDIFGRIEDAKEDLYVSEYSLSQTTLEQIFNMFATEGEMDMQMSNARLSRKIHPKE